MGVVTDKSLKSLISSMINIDTSNLITDQTGQAIVNAIKNIAIGGSSTLEGLTDVNILNPTNGQVLKYNSVSQEWENANESGGTLHNYSTTEHLVGTWINGHDVFEKTIVLRENGTDNFTYSNYIFNNALPTDIEWIDLVTFYAKRNSGGYVDCMNNAQETILVLNPLTQGVYYYDRHASTDVIITIRYTKMLSN